MPQVLYIMQKKAPLIAFSTRSLSWDIKPWEDNTAHRAAALGLALSSLSNNVHQYQDVTKSNNEQRQLAQQSNSCRCWRHRKHTDNSNSPGSAFFDNKELIKIFLPQTHKIQLRELCGQSGRGPQKWDESIFTLEPKGLKISIWTDGRRSASNTCLEG